MKNKYGLVGLVYLILVASIVITAVIQPFRFSKTYKKIQYTYQNIDVLALNVKSGIVKIQDQEEKSLELTIYYREDKPPQINQKEGELEIFLEEGNITAYVGIKLSRINTTIATGNLFVLIRNFNSTLIFRGNTGDALLNIANSNMTININISVGDIEIVASNSILNGSVSTNVGSISVNMQTRYGGKIQFRVNTGSTSINSSGFNVSKEKVGDGERGIVFRNPQLFYTELYVDTGEITITIMYSGS